MSAEAPLRIGVVCFASCGGSGVIAAELGCALARRGHVVHLIASAPPARGACEGAPVFFHEVPRAEYPLFQQSPYALSVASKVVEIAEDHRLDLVHAHYAVPHATSAYLAKQVLGDAAPKIVTTLHGTDVTRVGVEPSIQRINRFSVAASDAVTVPSQFLREAAYSQLGLPRSVHIDVLENFVDTQHFEPAAPRDRSRLAGLFEGGAPFSQDERVLVHVSNFRPVKRVGDVVEVFAKLAAERPTRLLLVGDGPDRAKVATRIRQLGLGPRTSFLGTRGEFAEYLRDTDLFLLPSETESFGLAALEALACGVPVVAYAVGGVPEVVRDEQTGRLVPPGDVEAMAVAARALLDDDARRVAMARAARAEVQARFAEGPAVDRYEALYRRTLSPRET